MEPRFTVRRYEPGDQRAIEALELRVETYRPEDQPEVDAMRERAALARASARALYERLGFRDIGHTLTGEYEYVWYALEL